MEERAANTRSAVDTRPKVSSIDEDEEYIPPRANYPLVRVIEQGRYETMAMLRNGEQLMLNIIFPVMALIALRFTGLIDEYANSVGVSRMDAAVPGVLALCVISTALSGQGIATGFDRRYGVLRFLATTPLGRNGLIMGKCIAVLVVVAIQFTLVAALGYGLGWRPDAIAVSRSIITMLMGAGAFTALGLLIAGTVRADGQGGVEQQHALVGPTREVAARGARSAEVVGDLFEDVLKRGGKGRAVLHREAEPVGLAGFVVGVLTDDDHLDAVEGTVRKGVEDVRPGGIDRRLAVLLTHEIGQFYEIVFLKFAGQTCLPARLHFYVHVVGLLGKL